MYRLPRAPSSVVNFPYVTVSDQIDGIQSVDLITIGSFRQVKEKLKMKAKKFAALEMIISPVRKMDGPAVGKWFRDVGEAYRFCESAGWQLILSSGAEFTSEMISGRCFDAILDQCGIRPDRYWRDLNKWLETTLAKRAMIQ